jgi:hypothetical protein
MDAEENQRQVFLRAHSPWKSQTTRFPHSHSRCSAWKSGKPKAGFPLSHLLSLLLNQTKKGDPAADRFAPASRLILQLENAGVHGRNPSAPLHVGRARAGSMYQSRVIRLEQAFQLPRSRLPARVAARSAVCALYGQVDNFRMRHSGVNVLSDRVPSVPGLNARDFHCYPEWDSKSRQIRSCRANRNSLSTLLL